MEKDTILKGTDEYNHLISLLESTDVSNVRLGLQIAHGCAPTVLKKLLRNMCCFFVADDGIGCFYDGSQYSSFKDLESYLSKDVIKNIPKDIDGCFQYLNRIYEVYGKALCNSGMTIFFGEALHWLKDVNFLPHFFVGKDSDSVYSRIPPMNLKKIKINTSDDQCLIGRYAKQAIHLQLQDVGCDETDVRIDTDKVLQVSLPNISNSIAIYESTLPTDFFKNNASIKTNKISIIGVYAISSVKAFQSWIDSLKRNNPNIEINLSEVIRSYVRKGIATPVQGKCYLEDAVSV